MTATTKPVLSTVDRFLADIERGQLSDDLYAPHATLDATVPGWRFQAHGSAAILGEYRRWFTGPCQLHVLERQPLPQGELVRYVQDFDESSDSVTTHHLHLLTIVDDQIVRDVVFCGGRWTPEVVAKMGTAVHAC